ncbi:hypothetical protein MMPV_007969 [Pyropia vietnamensis]
MQTSPAPSSASLIPPTFAALHAAATASVVHLLGTGVAQPLFEVSVPTPGGLNASGDGSAASERAAAAASVAVAVAIAAGIAAAGHPVCLLPCDAPCRAAAKASAVAAAGGGAPMVPTVARLADAPSGVAIVAVSPAGEAAWDALAAAVPSAATAVVVVNGQLCSGLRPWMPAYAIRPISGRGWVMIAHPDPGRWVLVNDRGVRLLAGVEVLSQGRLVRPNVAAAWQALLAAGGARICTDAHRHAIGDRPGRRYELPVAAATGTTTTTTTTLRLALGDITTAPTDAVVNAANEHMLGGHGVDGAIHAAAGPALLAACRALPLVSPDVRVRTGDAVLLPGGTGQLRAAHVIGAVGPIYADDASSAPLLASAVRRSLRLAAAEPSIRSVAFPALSCGVYGYPPPAAAGINMRVLAEEVAEGGCLARGELDEVWYYLFSPALYDVWAAAAAEAFGEGTLV